MLKRLGLDSADEFDPADDLVGLVNVERGWGVAEIDGDRLADIEG